MLQLWKTNIFNIYIYLCIHIYICYKASVNFPFFILSGDSLVSPSARYDPLSIGIPHNPHNHPSHSSIMSMNPITPVEQNPSRMRFCQSHGTKSLFFGGKNQGFLDFPGRCPFFSHSNMCFCPWDKMNICV